MVYNVHSAGLCVCVFSWHETRTINVSHIHPLLHFFLLHLKIYKICGKHLFITLPCHASMKVLSPSCLYDRNLSTVSCYNNVFICNSSSFLCVSISVSASYVTGPIPESSRSRHAPLYGRLVAEEHLPATHRDIHQVGCRCT